MSKLTKTLLVLAILGFVIGLIFVTGLINVGDAVALYITLPLGAIFFGLFLICKMLDKEAALHDAELSAALNSASNTATAKQSARKSCCEDAAHSHDKALASAH